MTIPPDFPTPTAHPAAGPLRSPSSGYVAFIDGLRAIAVISVLIHHLDASWLPGGFAGVDVFFTISGFVVSASVSRWSGGLGGFLSYFYARRLLRIAPALVTCLLATTLACTLVLPTAWLSSAIDSTGSWAFFGISNIYLATHQESYYSPTAAFNPFTHTWSLGVEEQFYLIFPLMFFAWTRGGRWRMASIAAFAGALGASFIYGAHRGQVDPTVSFYLISTRFWELAAGVLLFTLVDRWMGARSQRIHVRLMFESAAWLALAAIGFALVSSKLNSFPVPGAALAVVGVLGLIASLDRAGPDAALSRLLASPLASYVGKRSYSIYLWHWPVIVLMRWTCGVDSIAMKLVAVLTTLALADLSYRMIEIPVRHASLLRRTPRIAVVCAGVIVVAGSWWLADQTVRAKSSLSMSTVSRNASAWYPGLTPVLPEKPGCVLSAVADADNLASTYGRAGCDGIPASTTNLFVIGDSHAMAYSTLLSEYVLRTGASVRLYPNPGCTLASLQVEREGGHCPAQATKAIADIQARSKAGDVLFLAALRLNRLGTQFSSVEDPAVWQSMDSPDARSRRAVAEGALEHVLAPLASKGVRIVFDAPKPLFHAPAFRCADTFNASNPVCAGGLSESRDELEAYRAPVSESLRRIAERLPGATVWDPFPLLCPTDPCRAIVDGQPLYFDGDHLSAHANRLLARPFEQFITSPAIDPSH
jgi:peptidoglycan/LPS O-acetylase OafA/YrhL